MSINSWIRIEILSNLTISYARPRRRDSHYPNQQKNSTGNSDRKETSATNSERESKINKEEDPKNNMGKYKSGPEDCNYEKFLCLF